MTALHTDRLTLTPSTLEPRFARAIEAVEIAQAGDRQTGWEHHPHHEVLELGDGTVFIPDHEDAKAGTFGMIVGGIVAVSGLLLAAITIDGDQAERWMMIAAPLMVVLGGYFVWTGRRRNHAALAAPRRTKTYLFDDVLLHVSTLGCRTFPVPCIHGFDYRTRSGSNGFDLVVRYIDDAGHACDAVLFHRDATASLTVWLAGSSRSR